MIIQALLTEAGVGSIDREPVSVNAQGLEAAADWGSLRSAENYVGYARTQNFASPGGASCSIHFGTGVTSAVPGSARNLYLVVSNIEAARAELVDRGVVVSEVFHRAGPGKPPLSGRDPARRSYASYATFSDPDGNSWLLQEVTVRLPGRVDTDHTTFTSSTELATALRRAATAHGEHEKRTGQHDADWPDWYAEYIVREQAGKELPS